MDITIIISSLKDGLIQVVTLLIAWIGVKTAWEGLSTWKKQIRAKTEYELSRRILVNVYKVRDAIRGVRWKPDMFENEAEAKRIQRMAFDELDKVQRELDVERLEAAAIWMGETKILARLLQFSSLGTILKGAFMCYYDSNLDDPVEKQKNFDDLFESSDKTKDAFGVMLDDKVKAIEEALLDKIKLNV